MTYEALVKLAVLEPDPSLPEALKEMRARLLSRFLEDGLSRDKTEDRNQAMLKSVLEGDLYGPDESKSTAEILLKSETMDFLSSARHRVVFINGLFCKTLSRLEHLPRGVVLGSLAAQLGADPSTMGAFAKINDAGKTERQGLLNLLLFRDGLFLRVPDKVVFDEPVVALSLARPSRTDQTLFFCPRIWVEAGASTRVQIVLQEIGKGQARYVSHLVSDVLLGPGACLSLCHLQQPSKSGDTLSANRFFLDKHASLKVVALTSGGRITQSENTAQFRQSHGLYEFSGLSTLNGNSKVCQRVTADHRAEHCVSRQHYKSVLMDESQSDFRSLVRVRPGAARSDSRQLNRNLLLSDRANARSEPKLKIETDDVSCSHGSTTGPLEPTELFYLESRGLSQKAAKFILTRGFVQEILDEIPEDRLRIDVEQWVEKELRLGRLVEACA